MIVKPVILELEQVDNLEYNLLNLLIPIGFLITVFVVRFFNLLMRVIPLIRRLQTQTT